MTAFLIFCSAFVIVFLLGLQSLNVNNGHEWAACVNSCLIGVVNITILKLAPDAQGIEIAAYILGGPLGIVASMRYFRWYRARKEQTLVIKAMHDCKKIMERK